MTKRLLVVLSVLFLFGETKAQSNPFAKKLVKVDDYIDSLMKNWNVPGMAIAIVYKDQLIYGRGYGYRDRDKKLPMEVNTLFPIASNTKLFTATLACLLQQKSILNIDQPVTKYTTSIQFYNDELNAKVTTRDLLSHRTGIGRFDGIWGNSDFTREELVWKTRWMRPVLGFRESYNYNNIMFTTAGYLMERLTGESWETLTRKMILDPLGMKSTCFTFEEMKKQGNYSLSYYEIDSTKKLAPKSYVAISDALGPAGTIKSNIEDMSKWMIAQLNKGLINGKRVFDSTIILQTLVPNAIADKEGRWPEQSNSLYCLGRTIQTYKGLKIASHTGSIDGFYSNLSFVPEKQLAVFAVLNQTEAGSLRPIMNLPIIDILLDQPYTPWLDRARKDYIASKTAEKKFEDSVEATRVFNTQPSHSLSAYVGEYNNPIYGKINIKLAEGKLSLLFRKQESALHHFHYDLFVTKEDKNDLPNFRLKFLTNDKGEIDQIICAPLGDPEVSFKR